MYLLISDLNPIYHSRVHTDIKLRNKHECITFRNVEVKTFTEFVDVPMRDGTHGWKEWDGVVTVIFH